MKLEASPMRCRYEDALIRTRYCVLYTLNDNVHSNVKKIVVWPKVRAEDDYANIVDRWPKMRLAE